EDLLEDKRYLTVQRYLRRVYADPITGKADWGLVPAPGGGIMGVYSTAAAKPVRDLGAASYRDWKFAYEPPRAPSTAPGTPKR
ncbi:MAG: type II secretion system protein, partial [Burkholderiales bacterium]